MKIDEIVARHFAEGKQEAERGAAKTFTEWRFKTEPLTGAEPIKDVFVGREEILVRLSRWLGRSVLGSNKVLACVGAAGVGKTSLLTVMHTALQESGTIKGLMVKGERLVEPAEPLDDTEEEAVGASYFDVLVRSEDFSDVRYLIIDDADSISEYLPAYLERIEKSAETVEQQPALVIGINMGGWLSVPAEFRSRISEQVWVPPMEPEEADLVISKRLLWAKEDNVTDPFNDVVFSRIVDLSRGVPSLALGLARHAFQECIAREFHEITPELVDEVARTYGYDAFERLSNWNLGGDKTKRTVVEALVKVEEGVSSSILSDKAEIGRTTINYHLATLESLGVLAKNRRGHQVLYLLTGAGRCALEVLLFNLYTEGMRSWKT